ncbi:MAG TPA: cytochrome b/b6 domain-containing protein [Mycobacteriales bacterium]|jgi:formate dehydrogenase subunit gamma|nr:cytochrome b/b6 domain-containing protein [Mycobacteriales bacterium]
MHPPADRLPRFGKTERLVHRSTAVLVAVLFVSGLTLYYEPLAVLVSRRALVESTHIAAGLLLPLPMLFGLLTSPELRGDVSTLGRMTRADRSWLRRSDRRSAGLPVGKFNGGQKLAAATMAGAGLVLIGTGVLLLAPVRLDLPDGVREGATVTHDLFTFALLFLLAGHVWLAQRHPEARAAMRTGSVDRGYAEREHAAWAAEVAGRSGRSGNT